MNAIHLKNIFKYKHVGVFSENQDVAEKTGRIPIMNTRAEEKN